MSDPTEQHRKQLQEEINAVQASREALEKKYGEVLDTKQLQEHYRVEGFLAPFVVVTRLSDMQKGSLMFQHEPRFYFSFEKV